MICYECEFDFADNEIKLVDYEEYTGSKPIKLVDIFGKPCQKAEVILCSDCFKAWSDKKRMEKAREARKTNKKGD